MAEKGITQTSESKEDRISDLPDCLIHHILSFLPTTEQAIRTTVLSKRWHNQWTSVPVLIFYSNSKFSKNILKLYNCMKMKKFFCGYMCNDKENDSCFDEIVSFATRRDVEELELNCLISDEVLPESLFDNVSLVTLTTSYCNFMPKGKVNWPNLKALKLVLCTSSNQAMEHILCGCPLLELIELSNSRGFDKLVITSKYLKKIILREAGELRRLEISCPDLEELSINRPRKKDSSSFAHTMKNVLSVNSTLHFAGLDQLVITSESLKRLVVGNVEHIRCLEVSCTKLEKLELFGILGFDEVDLMNLPSSVLADLDFKCRNNRMKVINERLVLDILQQLHHVNKLKLGRWPIEVLSGLKVRDLFSPVLHSKCLILGSPGWGKEYKTGVACLLQNVPMLETLVIIEEGYERQAEVLEVTDVQESYRNSTVFNCSVSHLNTVKIVGSQVFLNFF